MQEGSEMPLKCQDRTLVSTTCTLHMPTDTRVHTDMHTCAGSYAQTVTETGRAHTVQICRPARPPGPWRWAQSSFRGALRLCGDVFWGSSLRCR